MSSPIERHLEKLQDVKDYIERIDAIDRYDLNDWEDEFLDDIRDYLSKQLEYPKPGTLSEGRREKFEEIEAISVEGRDNDRW